MSAKRLIVVALLASIVACSAYGLYYIGAPATSLVGVMRDSVISWGWLTVVNVVVIQMFAIACTLLLVRDVQGNERSARVQARLAIGLLTVVFLLSMLINGLTFLLVIYILQMVLIVSYQVASDPYLGEDVEPVGWVARVLSVVARGRYTGESKGLSRVGYMRLNVFNLFWVFVVASIAGLVVEDLWQLVVFHRVMSRAGLIWGPFSPIYGFGAVLLTLALNRVWNKGSLRIFLVGATIGATFEFWVSWFLEHAFGIVAWDYTGTFLNIDGRTNLFFWCAWGVLSLLWMRVLLPATMLAASSTTSSWRRGSKPWTSTTARPCTSSCRLLGRQPQPGWPSWPL